MNRQGIIDVILRHHPEVQAIYLFGSYGTEYQTPDSDIDLALLLPYSPRKQVPLIRSDCRDELSANSAREVDLIDLRNADTVFQNETFRTGRLLQSNDEDARLAFEALVLSLYQKLQEERSGILEQIMESKRVYNV
jgi:predicted nucleotidyltransferase